MSYLAKYAKKQKEKKKGKKDIPKADAGSPKTYSAGDQLRDARRTTAGGVLGFASPLGKIYATIKSREMHREMYGPNWKKKSKGTSGSFSARHPILANITPGVSQVSSIRAAGKARRAAYKALGAEEAKKKLKG